MLNFVMLNPSTADANTDDPTIRKCMTYARTWSYSKLVVTNLFAFRSPTPERLYFRPFDEICGPENNDYIKEVAKLSNMIVCGWGNHGELHGRGSSILKLLRKYGDPHYLSLNSSKQPGHPLYLSYVIQPKPFK